MSANLDKIISKLRQRVTNLPESKFRTALLDDLEELDTLLDEEAEDRHYQALADGSYNDYLRDLDKD